MQQPFALPQTDTLAQCCQNSRLERIYQKNGTIGLDLDKTESGMERVGANKLRVDTETGRTPYSFEHRVHALLVIDPVKRRHGCSSPSKVGDYTA
jgi:hypothetical protein